MNTGGVQVERSSSTDTAPGQHAIAGGATALSDNRDVKVEAHAARIPRLSGQRGEGTAGDKSRVTSPVVSPPSAQVPLRSSTLQPQPAFSPVAGRRKISYRRQEDGVGSAESTAIVGFWVGWYTFRTAVASFGLASRSLLDQIQRLLRHELRNVEIHYLTVVDLLNLSGEVLLQLLPLLEVRELCDGSA